MKKRLRKYLNNEVALLKTSLPIKDKFRILNNKKLKKNITYILIGDQEVLDARASLGLPNVAAIIKHLELYDGIGKTIGCGCILCRLKHKEYKTSQSLNKKRKFFCKLTHHRIDNLDTLGRPIKEKKQLKELRVKTHFSIQDAFKEEFDLKAKRNKILEIVVFPNDF